MEEQSSAAARLTDRTPEDLRAASPSSGRSAGPNGPEAVTASGFIVLVLSNSELVGLLPPLEVIASVEAALRAKEDARLVVPRRLHVDWNTSTLLAMPAVDEGSVGVKLVSVVPDNAARGLPVTAGIMILNDGITGTPLSLMNAGALTAQRTGAVGALGVKYQTPEDTDSVGIVGCGVQGAWQAIFACAVRPIREVFGFSRSPGRFTRFAETVRKYVPRVRVIRSESARELLERTTLVIAATTSTAPVLPSERRLLEGRHFISVGSYKPTMQELPDEVYGLARSVAVDSEHAREETGDLVGPLKRGFLREDDIFSIAEYVTGKRKSDLLGTTAYKTVGAAFYDLFVARAFYDAAKSLGVGREIAL